jgi:hypothetical protein
LSKQILEHGLYVPEAGTGTPAIEGEGSSERRSPADPHSLSFRHVPLGNAAFDGEESFTPAHALSGLWWLDAGSRENALIAKSLPSNLAG